MNPRIRVLCTLLDLGRPPRVTSRLVVRGQPGQSLVEAVARRRAGRLDVPIPVTNSSQSQLFLDFVRLHRFRQILFVGKDEDDGVPHLAVVDDPVELLPRLVDPVPVRAVNHEDQALSPRVVVAPKRPDFVLASDVPDVEFDVFVGHGLDVEADGGDGVDGLAQLELVQDGGLARGVQAQHEDPHLLVPKHFRHDLPHLGGGMGAHSLVNCKLN